LSVKLQSLRRLTALYVIKLGAVLGYDEAFINAPLTSSVSIADDVHFHHHRNLHTDLEILRKFLNLYIYLH